MIFYVIDRDHDGKIYFREFIKSNFNDNLLNVEDYNEEDNLEFNLFSYDYFYIFCCLYNDLDDDQNGFIGI